MELNMALTEKEEKDLKDGLVASTEAISDLTAKHDEMDKTIKSKDAVIAELQKGHQMSSEDRAIADLRTKFPSVPEATLRALPPAAREEQGKLLHEAFSKVAPATDPLKAWSRVGSVIPNLDAETEAEKIERSKAKDKAVAEGNPAGVIAAKGKDIARFVMSALVPH